MTVVPLYSFPARMDSLDSALAHLKSSALDLEPALALRAETALEELLTNSVLHGSRGNPEPASVWLAVSIHPQGLRLRFEDAFFAFDPLAEIRAALERVATPIEERRAGGLGLLMVYRLADEFRYARENERNRIDLSFRGRRTT